MHLRLHKVYYPTLQVNETTGVEEAVNIAEKFC